MNRFYLNNIHDRIKQKEELMHAIRLINKEDRWPTALKWCTAVVSTCVLTLAPFNVAATALCLYM